MRAAAAEQRASELESESKRLREELEWYADEKNWKCSVDGEWHDHDESCDLDRLITRDDHGYERAQRALGKDQ